MDGHNNKASDRPGRPSSEPSSHRLKVELRREERQGRGEEMYAQALRRVLQAISRSAPDKALDMLSQEIEELEARDDVEAEEVDALRRVLALTGGQHKESRELFEYYLRRMEADGRGDEPFAQALRKVLQSPGTLSLKDRYDWVDPDDDSAD